MVAIGVDLLLSKIQTPQHVARLRLCFIVAGVLLAAIGLIGFVLLRAETFTGSMTGQQMNFHQLSQGNLLLMLGLTLGVPLIVGTLLEDAMARFRRSKDSIKLFRSKADLMREEVELKQILGRMQAFNDQLDGVSNEIIKSRQGRYIRGYARGARFTPEAAQKLKLSGLGCVTAE
jgi:hypothetical protein